MKLIDKEQLHYKRVFIQHEYDAKGDVVVFAKDIDKQPTIEAIPTDWIELYANVTYSCVKEKEREVLQMLLKDWRKANEI